MVLDLEIIIPSGGTVAKHLPANAGDKGSICELGRSLGVGNGNPLFSYLENSMDRGTWRATIHRVAESWPWLSDWTHTHTVPSLILPARSPSEPSVHLLSTYLPPLLCPVSSEHSGWILGLNLPARCGGWLWTYCSKKLHLSQASLTWHSLRFWGGRCYEAAEFGVPFFLFSSQNVDDTQLNLQD